MKPGLHVLHRSDVACTRVTTPSQVHLSLSHVGPMANSQPRPGRYARQGNLVREQVTKDRRTWMCSCLDPCGRS